MALSDVIAEFYEVCDSPVFDAACDQWWRLAVECGCKMSDGSYRIVIVYPAAVELEAGFSDLLSRFKGHHEDETDITVSEMKAMMVQGVPIDARMSGFTVTGCTFTGGGGGP